VNRVSFLRILDTIFDGNVTAEISVTLFDPLKGGTEFSNTQKGWHMKTIAEAAEMKNITPPSHDGNERNAIFCSLQIDNGEGSAICKKMWKT
jgi:hypothetical protein